MILSYTLSPLPTPHTDGLSAPTDVCTYYSSPQGIEAMAILVVQTTSLSTPGTQQSTDKASSLVRYPQADKCDLGRVGKVTRLTHDVMRTRGAKGG